MSADMVWRDETPEVVRCAHHHCRTSLTEGDEVQCPHGLTFCEWCTWEEACLQCAVPPMPDLPPVEAEAPCRCGWRRDGRYDDGKRPGPVVDLRDYPEDVLLTVTDAQRSCAGCEHPIGSGTPVVVVYGHGGMWMQTYYHPACVKGVKP